MPKPSIIRFLPHHQQEHSASCLAACEQALSSYVGTRHAIGVNSGASSLHLCINCARSKPRSWITGRYGVSSVEEVGIHYPVSCHLQPAFQPLGYSQGNLSVTEQVAGEIVSSQYSGISGPGSHAFAPTPALPHVGRERAAPAISLLWGGLEVVAQPVDASRRFNPAPAVDNVAF